MDFILTKKQKGNQKKSARIWAYKYILAHDIPLEQGSRNKHLIKALNDHINPHTFYKNLVSIWLDVGKGVSFTKKEMDKIKSIKNQKNKSWKKTTGFYISREWRELRYKVLQKNDGCCCLCGRSKAKHDIILHVDHIKPRSKFPKLELDINNLQILCEDCNLGKSNKDSIDWRKEDDVIETVSIEAVITKSVQQIENMEEYKEKRKTVVIRRRPTSNVMRTTRGH